MKSAAPDIAVSAERYGAYGAEYRFSPVEDSTDEAMRWLFACWNEMRGERDMPQRDELNPRALGPFLRNVQLFEVVDGGKDFRCRVYGTGIYEVTGLHMTGSKSPNSTTPASANACWPRCAAFWKRDRRCA